MVRAQRRMNGFNQNTIYSSLALVSSAEIGWVCRKTKSSGAALDKQMWRAQTKQRRFCCYGWCGEATLVFLFQTKYKHHAAKRTPLTHSLALKAPERIKMYYSREHFLPAWCARTCACILTRAKTVPGCERRAPGSKFEPAASTCKFKSYTFNINDESHAGVLATVWHVCSHCGLRNSILYGTTNNIVWNLHLWARSAKRDTNFS
jgi:hypothetical protein